VYLAYDQHNLYAVFVCWGTATRQNRARMTRREDIFSDDSAEIMIDTFHDAPPGLCVRRQPLRHPVGRAVTEGSMAPAPRATTAFDPSFDTVWRSKTPDRPRLYLLTAIPSRACVPHTDQQEWGIILNRSIREPTNLFWPRITNRIQGRFNQPPPPLD